MTKPILCLLYLMVNAIYFLPILLCVNSAIDLGVVPLKAALSFPPSTGQGKINIMKVLWIEITHQLQSKAKQT